MSSRTVGHNARFVTPDAGVIANELKQIGAQSSGREIIGRKTLFHIIKLERLSCVAANVLKQEMLARGGDCALHSDCLTLERDETQVLISGTRPQIEELAGKLLSQSFGLTAVAREINSLLLDQEQERGDFKLGPYTLPLGARTLIMGIINMTPDSFSGDALGEDVEAALEQARRMRSEGADLLDVGAQSTRPGASPVSEEEELSRVLPVIRRLSGPSGVELPLSVDTSRAAVARAALEAGAHMINDVTGLRAETDLAEIAARYGAGLVLMHMRGTPATMQDQTSYVDLMGDICGSLRWSLDKAIARGVNKERVWLDPGIGFAKNADQNLEILKRLRELRSLGCPVLVGVSRKAFIGRLLSHDGEPVPPAERVTGTGAALAVAVANGAGIVRVHDVAHAVEAVRVADAIVRQRVG